MAALPRITAMELPIPSLPFLNFIRPGPLFVVDSRGRLWTGFGYGYGSSTQGSLNGKEITVGVFVLPASSLTSFSCALVWKVRFYWIFIR